MSSQVAEKLTIGYVSGIYGVHGWVKVFSHTDPRENILNYSPWLLNVNGEWQLFEVLDGQTQQGGKSVVAKLSGISDRDLARSYMGCDIAISKHQLPEIDDGYYWSELIGCAVVNENGMQIGFVDNLLETGAHDVLRVKREDSFELIPFVVDEFILEIDLDNKLIRVDWEPSED